jgi:hypothetical protein
VEAAGAERSVSKSQFKPRALAYLREVERPASPSSSPTAVDPVLRITPYAPPRRRSRRCVGCVVRYDAATEPVGVDDWEAG